MNQIKILCELDEKQVNQAITVFVEGFYNVFSSIFKDKEKLHKLFKYSFDYDMAYAYLQDGEAIGFLGLANYRKRPVVLNKEVFMEMMGGFAGKVSYKAISAALGKPNITDPQDICIDYIATSPEHRSKGIGTEFIRFMRDNLDYKHIKLEVFSKNTRAKAFYEREGFRVIKVRRDLMMMLRGFGSCILMRLDTE